jgi:hypothetical protein
MESKLKFGCYFLLVMKKTVKRDKLIATASTTEYQISQNLYICGNSEDMKPSFFNYLIFIYKYRYISLNIFSLIIHIFSILLFRRIIKNLMKR